MSFEPKLHFLPEGKEGGGILPWVIAVMVYLCTIAAAAGLGIYNAAQDWSADLNNSATIQIVQADPEQRQLQAEAALTLLQATPGVAAAALLSDDDLRGLLEPWLGSGNVSEDLPVPALITLDLLPGVRLNLDALSAQLAEVAPDARLDDHQQWIGELSRTAGAVGAAAILAVLLIVFATTAIVVFGAQARLASHRENIEIIHLMGAEDSEIAQEFRYRFMYYGVRGGLIGFVLAAASLTGIFYLATGIEGGLVQEMSLTLPQTVGMFAIPLITALISRQTAGITVMRALAKIM
jgi:cell division transport system permease protein